MQPDEPKPPLKFRKLRIAWSVFWGVACVLLVLLWARSYHRWDDLEFGVLRRAVEIQTNPGHLIIEYANYPHFGGVRFTSFAGANDKFLHNGIPNFWLGFGVLNLSNG